MRQVVGFETRASAQRLKRSLREQLAHLTIHSQSSALLLLVDTDHSWGTSSSMGPIVGVHTSNFSGAERKAFDEKLHALLEGLLHIDERRGEGKGDPYHRTRRPIHTRTWTGYTGTYT